MRRIILLALGFIVLGGALYYQHTQEGNYNQTRAFYDDLQRELRAVDTDIAFLKENHMQLNFIAERGWFASKSRLVGGEDINRWKGPLNAVRFRIEPETIKEMEDGHIFKISKIIIEIDALLDDHVYDFIQNILKNFPGILVPRKLSVHRNERGPNFIVGELIFEWFSMGGEWREE